MRAGDERVRSSTARVLHGGHGHDLLGEHVERVARHDGGLDRALAHAPGDHRALEQVGAELGEDAALRGLADAVAGAADALQAARDGLGRLDLQDEVDRAHVDAELEELVATRQGSSPDLSSSSTSVRSSRASEPWWARAIVLLGELVEAQGQALGAAAVVDEDEGRAVLAHELEQLGVDRGPDRAARGLAALRAGRPRARRALLGLDHRLDRDVDLEVERLAHAGVDDPALCAAARRGSARSPPAGSGWRDRPMRCTGRSASASSRSSVSARWAPRLVAATAWISSTITHSAPVRISRACDVSMRYSDSGVVMRMSGGVAAHGLRGRAGACRRCGSRHRSRVDAAQRGAQVALDVVGQGLQRRDVDQPRALSPSGSGSEARRSSAPEERRQRLARAGRARRSARARPTRSPATPAPGRGSALRTRPRTKRGRGRELLEGHHLQSTVAGNASTWTFRTPSPRRGSR